MKLIIISVTLSQTPPDTAKTAREPILVNHYHHISISHIIKRFPFQWQESVATITMSVSIQHLYRIFAHIPRGLCTFLHAIRGCAGYTRVLAIQNHFYTILCTMSAVELLNTTLITVSIILLTLFTTDNAGLQTSVLARNLVTVVLSINCSWVTVVVVTTGEAIKAA